MYVGVRCFFVFVIGRAFLLVRYKHSELPLKLKENEAGEELDQTEELMSKINVVEELYESREEL